MRIPHFGLLALLAACGSDGGSGDPTTPPQRYSLQVGITGLPAGATPDVRLVGPGIDRAISGPVAVGDLPAGTYFLRTQAVTGAAPAWPLIPEDTIVLPGASFANARYSHLPVGGAAVSRFFPFDDVMVSYMRGRNIRAGVLAVARGNAVVYQRSFGWADTGRTAPLAPTAAFRVASLSKPMTMALVQQLVDAGTIAWGTPVYAYLGLSTFPGRAVDARAAQITVQHLLDHRAGWQAPPGWIPDYRAIARMAGRSGPPTTTDVARWTMGLSFAADPGAVENYSNLGYLLLGLVIEKATGQDWLTAVRTRLLPLSVAGDVLLAASRPADRDPREPPYLDPGTGCSVFDANACVPVPMPDGGFHFEGFTSYGGIVATTRGYLAFMQGYRHDGRAQPVPAGTWWYWYGSINGTYALALWRGDGTRVVAFFNQRTDPSGLAYDQIAMTMNAAASAIAWP